MALPTNRVKLRIVRGTYANIAASTAALVDGELCYANDQNLLYMYENTTLTPLNYLSDSEVSTLINGGTGLSASYDAGLGIWTIDLDNTGVSSGTYGTSTSIPRITVNAQGQITSITTNTVSTSAGNLTVIADSGANQTINLDTETLTLSGGSGIDTTTQTNGVTFSVNDTYIRDLTGITATKEPMGFDDPYLLDTTISFTDASRTFTITPTGASFDVWCQGIKYTKASAETLVIPNTSGIYYIYYDSTGALAYNTTYFDFSLVAPVAYVYWNVTDATAYYLGDERHGIVLDWQTHEYLHLSRGAAYVTGGDASNYTLTGDGSLDAHAQLDINDVLFFDEDILHAIIDGSSQQLSGPGQFPVLYRDGTVYKLDTATDYPLKQGSSYVQYNSYDAGTGNWSMVDANANRYVVYWLVATNNQLGWVTSIAGQAQYNNIQHAEAAAFYDMNLAGMPVVEFRPLYKLIFQTGSYANTPSARLRGLFDIRRLENLYLGGNPVTDHGTLAGLTDDDHEQYLHIDNTRAAITATIATSGTLETSNTTASTSTTTGALIVGGGAGIAGDVYIGGDLTVSGDTVTIDAQTIIVEDKNIELGNVTSPSDITADEGGITLKGTTDKTIKWLDATDAWTFSEHIDLASAKEYRIDGTSVLNATTLGSGVTGSSLTSVGTIATGTWSATEIAVTKGGTGLTSIAKGTVLVANASDVITALDGGGTSDAYLFYDAATDTISWVTEIDGGTW